MWFILSLIAVFFWSGSDLFSKMGSRADDKYSHYKLVMTVGTVMGIHAVIMLALGQEFALSDIITYLPASAFYIISMTLGYVGLRYLMLSISSPICNSSGVIVAIMYALFFNVTIAPLQIFGIALVTIGIISLSVIERRKDTADIVASGQAIDGKYTKSAIAFIFPVLYCIIDSMGTFTDAILLDESRNLISEGAANIAYELTFFAMAVCAFIYVVIIKKQKFVISKEKPKLIAAVCETAGQLAYVYALGSNAVLAAPLISSYCVFSLIWARFVLKEKLTKAQYLVVCIAFVGIAILGME